MKKRSSPTNRTDQKPDTTHCGRIRMNGKATAICACGWNGAGRDYRRDALQDLLDHYEAAGTMREQAHPNKAINDNQYGTWTSGGRVSPSSKNY